MNRLVTFQITVLTWPQQAAKRPRIAPPAKTFQPFIISSSQFAVGVVPRRRPGAPWPGHDAAAGRNENGEKKGANVPGRLGKGRSCGRAQGDRVGPGSRSAIV